MRRSLGFLFATWIASLSQVYGQTFSNLDFESPRFVPVSSPYSPSSVDPTAALPGWTAYWGTSLAPYILHDNAFLDSAGISILDTNFSPGFHPLQGRYTLLLQGGFALNGYPNIRLSTSVAQTAVIPSWANSMTFLVEGANYAVSVNGQSFYNPTGTVDISAFSGQSVQIGFTAFPYPAPGLAINNVLLDGIQFSTAVVPEPGSFTLLLLGSIGWAWRCRKE